MRIRKKIILNAQQAILDYYNLVVSEAQAKQVLEAEPTLIEELDGEAFLDTAPREDLGGAIITVIMPEKPTVRDALIQRKLEYWHFPCNASSSKYTKAFFKRFAQAAEEHKMEIRLD